MNEAWGRSPQASFHQSIKQYQIVIKKTGLAQQIADRNLLITNPVKTEESFEVFDLNLENLNLFSCHKTIFNCH